MRINLTEIDKTLINQVVVVVCALGFSTFFIAQDWQPEFLSDGQPNITGMWNNVGATATPLEMPAEFDGKVPTADEVADFIWHHYACTSRSDTSFWKHYAELDGKTTLLQRIQNNTNLKQNLYPSYVYAYLAIYYGITNNMENDNEKTI